MSVEQTVQRTSGYAVASLVLGIAGIFIFPVIPSILAIVFGYKARDEIRASSAVGGDGLATAGVVLGWVGVVLTALLLLIGLFVLFAVAGV